MPRSTAPCLQHSQNFIRDPRLVDYLLDCTSIQSRDTVYEIGPGTGTITGRLALRCRRLVAVEKDVRLAACLQRRYQAHPNITIDAADFLEYGLPSIPFKVFANIPFAITTAIVDRLTNAVCPPRDSYLIVQREAADRFVGYPRSTLYAALLHPWFAATVMHCFRPSDFRPAPNVDSVLLRLQRRDQPLVPVSDTQCFRDFVTFAFTAPHPTLRHTLQACGGRSLARHLMRAARLDPEATPSMVPGTLWLLLFEHMKDAGGEHAMRAVAGFEQRLRREQRGLRKLHRTRPF